jgi:hypothetical protein
VHTAIGCCFTGTLCVIVSKINSHGDDILVYLLLLLLRNVAVVVVVLNNNNSTMQNSNSKVARILSVLFGSWLCRCDVLCGV